jgi:hypothetical protein
MRTEITRAKYERKEQRYASDVTDGEWALIERSFPGRGRWGDRGKSSYERCSTRSSTSPGRAASGLSCRGSFRHSRRCSTIFMRGVMAVF